MSWFNWSIARLVAAVLSFSFWMSPGFLVWVVVFYFLPPPFAISGAARSGAKLVSLPECFNSPYAVTAFPKYAEVVPNHSG